jgi:hypothetical protein
MDQYLNMGHMLISNLPLKDFMDSSHREVVLTMPLEFTQLINLEIKQMLLQFKIEQLSVI